jgi:hypothetical protein
VALEARSRVTRCEVVEGGPVIRPGDSDEQFARGVERWLNLLLADRLSNDSGSRSTAPTGIFGRLFAGMEH